MDTAFLIGNGESRNIFPIENLKDKGVIYGCNAIYRDHPMLCDHIVAVNQPMYDELAKWHNNGKESPRYTVHKTSADGTTSVKATIYTTCPRVLRSTGCGVAETSRTVARSRPTTSPRQGVLVAVQC